MDFGILRLERDLGVLHKAEFVAGNAVEQFGIIEHFQQPVDRGVSRFVGHGNG